MFLPLPFLPLLLFSLLITISMASPPRYSLPPFQNRTTGDVPKSFGTIFVQGVGEVHVMGGHFFDVKMLTDLKIYLLPPALDWMNIEVTDNGFTGHG